MGEKLDKEAKAAINRQNAQKSTGPKTPEGKRISRCNALKHALTATLIIPIDAPGEPEGAYQKRLDFWLNDIKPQNVFEYSIVERACRSTWKLDRCARYEDAAAARRGMNGPEDPVDTKVHSNRKRAEETGGMLMFALQNKDLTERYGPPAHGTRPDTFDDAQRDANRLATFKEGVEWLINTWHEVLPLLPFPDGPPIEGAANVLEHAADRALRLLGVPTGTNPPAQNLHEAGLAELKRLEGLHREMSAQVHERIDADLCLFDDSPTAFLLIRYEAAAERGLYKAINELTRLRKNPELFPPSAEVKATAETVDKPEKTAENAAKPVTPRFRRFPLNEPDPRDCLNVELDPKYQLPKLPKSKKRRR